MIQRETTVQHRQEQMEQNRILLNYFLRIWFKEQFNFSDHAGCREESERTLFRNRLTVVSVSVDLSDLWSLRSLLTAPSAACSHSDISLMAKCPSPAAGQKVELQMFFLDLMITCLTFFQRFLSQKLKLLNYSSCSWWLIEENSFYKLLNLLANKKNHFYENWMEQLPIIVQVWIVITSNSSK